MACKQCGSDWVTPTGKDCNRCPSCDKQQRFQARKQGRLPSETQKTCSVCGIVFTATPQRQAALTCGSEACRKVEKQEKIRRHKARKRAGLAATTGPRQASRPRKTCKRRGCCNLVKDNRHDYCGRACAGLDAQELIRPVSGRTIAERKAVLVAAMWATLFVEWMKCECCGKHVVRRSKNQRVCGEKCSYRLEKPLYEHCCDCGTALKADTRYIKRCETCKRKRRNHWKRIAGKTPRKRCRRHGVPCDPIIKSVGVFERDGYRCQLCDRKCLEKFKVVHDMPHPRSPTVDHIIAISLGIKGHTWDNVQCACWECNVSKGASAKGQLRLSAW
jgi:hypothetical protein